MHQVGAEPVVAGFDRRMRRENAFAARLRSMASCECFACGHFFADQFQSEKRRVPFVHVKHGGLDASARSNRTPPMPSRISCMMRVVLSPP